MYNVFFLLNFKTLSITLISCSFLAFFSFRAAGLTVLSSWTGIQLYISRKEQEKENQE